MIEWKKTFKELPKKKGHYLGCVIVNGELHLQLLNLVEKHGIISSDPFPFHWRDERGVAIAPDFWAELDWKTPDLLTRARNERIAEVTGAKKRLLKELEEIEEELKDLEDESL